MKVAGSVIDIRFQIEGLSNGALHFIRSDTNDLFESLKGINKHLRISG